MRKRKVIVLRLVLIACSTLFLILVLELFLRWFFPQKTYSVAQKSAVSCFQKSDITPFTLKPNCAIHFQDFDTGEWFSTRTNSLGYRGKEFSLEKQQGEKRILLSGDSFILGFGVKDKDLVSTKLEEKLQKLPEVTKLSGASVINAGYKGGFGPDGYFLHEKYEGAKLKPDLVIFSIFAYNDFTDMANDEWIGTGPNGEPNKVTSSAVSVDDNGYLISKNAPFLYRIPILRDSHLAVFFTQEVAQGKEKMRFLEDKVRFALFPPEVPSGDAKDSNLPGPYMNACIFGDLCHRKILHLFTDLMSLLTAARNEVNSAFTDGKNHFLVVLIPADFQIYKEAQEKYKLDTGIPFDAFAISDPNPQKRLRLLLEKENIAYIDLLPVMRQKNEKLYFAEDGHWNRKGHEVVAEEIYKWIVENYH